MARLPLFQVWLLQQSGRLFIATNHYMATLFPKKGKRARAADAAAIAAEAAAAAEASAAEAGVSVFAQFERVDGEKVGPTVDLPVSVTGRDMDLVLNELSGNSGSEQKYEFFVGGIQITGKISAVLGKLQLSSESVVAIQFQPQSIHRIAAVTRCTSSLPGHTEAIICSQFSPDCLQLATGGGDACVRLWDMNTETPRFVCKGHKNWVRFPSHGTNSAFATNRPPSAPRFSFPSPPHQTPLTLNKLL